MIKVLYLIYGRQSGVIHYLTKALVDKEIKVNIFNPREKFCFNINRFEFPSPKPQNVFNSALALWQYKLNWRRYFYRTSYAFKLMTKNAGDFIKKNKSRFDVVLQSGVLFGASIKPLKTPYFLYLDNTTAIYEQSIPISVHTTNIANTKWKSMEKDVYEKADRIFTMSKCVQKSLENDYGVSPMKIRVIGAGPNMDVIPQLENKVYKSPTILFVGKDFRPKGGEILLSAFKQVRKQIPSAKLVVVGPREVIRSPGVIGKGWVDFRAMPNLYREASIFVLPTLREAFGISFLEAMAYQLPCIGTDIQAIPEIIDNGKTGFIVPLLNSKELSDKIIALLQNEELMKKMGQEGYRKVRDHYNWELVASKMASEFEAIARSESGDS
jgi:glycosyltransferase involved in cell wall biosynthesis